VISCTKQLDTDSARLTDEWPGCPLETPSSGECPTGAISSTGKCPHRGNIFYRQVPPLGQYLLQASIYLGNIIFSQVSPNGRIFSLGKCGPAPRASLLQAGVSLGEELAISKCHTGEILFRKVTTAEEMSSLTRVPSREHLLQACFPTQGIVSTGSMCSHWGNSFYKQVFPLGEYIPQTTVAPGGISSLGKWPAEVTSATSKYPYHESINSFAVKCPAGDIFLRRSVSRADVVSSFFVGVFPQWLASCSF
jgi:hypothetical protein